MKALASLVLAACVAPGPPAPAPPVPVAAPAIAATPVEPTEGWAGLRFDRESTRITRVMRSGPAAAAGLRAGDVVVSIGAEPALSADHLVRTIRARPAGDRLALVVARDGAQLAVTLTLEARPELIAIIKRELEGTAAPAFEASPLSGPYPSKLADLRGHVVVLDFWATWCLPCKVSMPVLDAWNTKYGAKGLRVVGLSDEGRADIQSYVTAHALAYTIAHDAEAQIARSYMVTGWPTLVVIDRAGIIRLVHLGADHLDHAEALIRRLL